MNLTIYTYGYSKLLFETLQGLALIRGTILYTSVVSAISLIIGIYYALQMVASGGQWRSYLMKIFGMIFVVHALLLPKANMSIKDNVEKAYYRVHNVPLAFALPVGFVEAMGHAVTGLYEQAFVSISSKHFDYYNYGTIFGARLAKEVTESKIRDPEVVSNMHHFINRCVVLPAMIGTQFTKEELVSTTNIWELVSNNAGTFTRSPMTIKGTRKHPAPTCKEAVNYFEDKFAEAFYSRIGILSKKLVIPGKGASMINSNSNRMLNNNIKSQITALYGNSNSVSDIINHSMMVNALSDYRTGNYTMAKAKMQHESGGLINGDLADHLLTKLLVVMKVIVYGSFIFVVPLMIMTGGMAKYKSWIIGVLSLQLWPPIYAMLNMIIDYAYDPAQIVSYSVWSTEVAKFDSIASVAANLSLMVPFLALWLTNMGSGGLMHLAGSLMSSAASATAAAAAERTNGGRSYDNTSIGNTNRDNTSANKFDDTQQHFTGTQTMFSRDGSTAKMLPGGEMVHFGGAGSTSSTGEATYRESDGKIASYENQKSHEDQLASSAQASKDTVDEKLINNEVSALMSVAQATKTDKGYNIDTSTEQGKEWSKSLNAIDQLNKENNYGWQQNARTYLSGETTFGTPARETIGFGASSTLGGEVSAVNESSQSNSHHNQLSSDQGTRDSARNAERAAKNEAFLESIGVDKNQQESIRESYNESERLSKTISHHKSNSDALSERINYVRNHSNEFSKDMFQDVANAYQKKYDVSSTEAHKAVSAGAPAAKAIFRDLSAPEIGRIKNSISTEGAKIKNSNNVQTFYDNNQLDPKIGRVVNDFAKDNNIMSTQQAKAHTDQVKARTQDKFNKDYQNADDQYNMTRSTNAILQKERKELIDKNEADRMGNGILARTISAPVNLNFKDGIGRSQKDTPQMTSLTTHKKKDK